MRYNIKSKNGISYRKYDIQRALDKMFGKNSLEVTIEPSIPIIKIIKAIEKKGNDCVTFYFVCKCGFNTNDLDKCREHCEKYVKNGSCLLSKVKKL